MSPVADRTGPVSEISPCLFRCVYMKGRAGSVPEISLIKRAGNFAICFSFLLGMTAVPREIENNAPNQKNAASIRGDATATIPWVPEVLSRVRRGASFRRPQADTCSAEGRGHERRLTETGNRA